ncbi:MAG TPA: phycobiliprotein lyase [Nostocaceae cyanobacterium]|nr:phycobiliprotein lyase [Nostocaceae cyanobacterium]
MHSSKTYLDKFSQLTTQDAANLIKDFLKASDGKWCSERRYYALPNGKIRDIKKTVSMKFLDEGCTELIDLAQLHQLDQTACMECGSYVEWNGVDLETGEEGTKRWTVLGTIGDTMYFGRNFPVPRLVIAKFYFRDPQTIYLWTEENGSLFEEELKFIGKQYRTRQTVISRAGQQQMIAQYLEKLIE